MKYILEAVRQYSGCEEYLHPQSNRPDVMSINNKDIGENH